MIGIDFDTDVPVYLRNEAHPAVIVFLHRDNEEEPWWKVCVPRVGNIRFGNYGSVYTQTLPLSFAGKRLSDAFATPTLFVYRPARLVLRMVSSYVGRCVYALVVDRGLDERARPAVENPEPHNVNDCVDNLQIHRYNVSKY